MNNLDKLIELINKENIFPKDLNMEEKELLFSSYLLSSDTKGVDEKFLYIQDQYLHEKNCNNITYKQASQMKVINSLDIVTDLLVVFSENLILNNSSLCDIEKMNTSIDSQLIIRGGLQIKEQLYNQYERDMFVIYYRKPYLIKSENLNAKNVAKLLIDTKCDNLECGEKLSANIDNLLEWVKTKAVSNAVVDVSSLPSSLKHDKKFIKNIKNTLKSSKIKLFYV